MAAPRLCVFATALLASAAADGGLRNETFVELRANFARGDRTTFHPFESDAAMRSEWKRINKRPYPGEAEGGLDLNCGARGALHPGEARKKYAEEVIKAFVRERDLPLARSLEIGPCNFPVDLPTAIIREQDSVDSPASLARATWA